MQELDDIALLREYTERNSDEAFATLITRHIDRVYSVALRHAGNPHHAEEITQAVFVILARKARQLGKSVILAGWLYKTARLTALTHVRGEIRRARREQEAHMETILSENESEVWTRITPELDTALAGLNETDRNAVVLRFFYGKSLREIGITLGTNEDTARMRVNRAVEKLRTHFSKHGVTSTTETLAGAISANAVQAAPAALAKAATAIALAKGATASAATTTLIKGALKIMAWSKTTATVAISAAAIFAIGTTAVVVSEFSRPSVEDIFKHMGDDSYLEKAPPVIILQPSQHQGPRMSHMHGPPFSRASERFVYTHQPLPWVLAVAYDTSAALMIVPTNLPFGTFDFLDTVSKDPTEALQAEIKRQFGLVAHTETRPTEVLILKVSKPDAPGLKVNGSGSPDAGILVGQGSLTLQNFAISGAIRAVDDNSSHEPMTKTNFDSSLVRALGQYFFDQPVIDETGLTNCYDIELHWNGALKGEAQTAAVKQALRDQLGLELVPERRPVEMVVVEYEDGRQLEPPLAQAHWTFVGYDTPESGFQSALAAMSKGDAKMFLDCLTPDYRKAFMATDGKGKTEARIGADNKHKASEIVAYQVVSKEVMSDSETILYLRSTKRGEARVTMKRVSENWKMDGEPH